MSLTFTLVHKPLKLNLGCGNYLLKNYKNIDIVKTAPRTIVADIRHLDYAPDTVDEIYIRHTIEHFYKDEIKTMLKDFCKMLKPKHKLIIETVDFEAIIHGWLGEQMDKELLNEFLFGFYAYENIREREPYMLHKFIFDYWLLHDFLREAGFNDVKWIKQSKPFNYDSKYGDFFTSMKVVAIK